MRQGELLGFKWTDLDWYACTLSVSRQLSQLKSGGYVFNPPKTKAGKRKIDLGAASMEVMRQYQYLQHFEFSHDPSWNEEDMIFPSKAGTPMDAGNLRRMYRNIQISAGLPIIRFHDLRHTAATLMLNNGVPVIIVSKRLGHTKTSTPVDYYGHLIPGQQKIAANLMDQLLTPIRLDIQVSD